MNRVELKHIPLRPPNPFARWRQKAHGTCFGLFLVALALVWLRLWLPGPLWLEGRWPDGLLIVLATATTLASLARHLPGQNVILVAVVIGAFGGAAASLGAITAVPFGPFVYDRARIGQLVFDTLPWVVPMMWVVAILNARGVGRVILRPWRLRPNYGYWLMGLTILLVVVLDLAFEPYATTVKQYWSWKPTRIPSTWYGMPWVNSLGWAVASLLILLFVTPTLITKSPIKHPLAQHPLWVWELLSAVFLTGAFLHQLWGATGLVAAEMTLVGVFGVRGIRHDLRSQPQLRSPGFSGLF